ncbi:hypothetical protein M9H77_17269 [Catharanthus roseus]|uniref:Uncharacterized protein n=1 Tax=Catharanthus roseus TaxID=4058 RepID=A0ACC0B456_CATRO|nr:hypothetical protein M9H77_17269 [Catharanthus roseus]
MGEEKEWKKKRKSSLLNTFVKHHEDFTLRNQFLLYVNEHFELPCNGREFFKDDKSKKTLLRTNNCGFQFFHLHFKESILFCESENKGEGSFKVLKFNLCGPWKTTFENGVFGLILKELVEKHLEYIISFIEFLRKDVFLNDLLVQNKNSNVLSMLLAFSVTCFITYLLKSS